MVRFRIRTNWTNSVSRTHEFELDDLADASTRDRLKWAFSGFRSAAAFGEPDAGPTDGVRAGGLGAVWWGQGGAPPNEDRKGARGATRRGRRTRARGRERRAPGAEGRRTWERRSPLGRGREGLGRGRPRTSAFRGIAAHQAQHHPTRGDETAREMASGDDGRRANGGRRSTAPESGPAPSQPPTTEGGGGTCRQHGIT